GYWAVGVLFGTLLVLAVPGLLRLQEPTVGVYGQLPAADLARRAVHATRPRGRRPASASAGTRSLRSGRCIRSASDGGSTGATPVARSAASGNLAAGAVASATSGPAPAPLRMRPAVSPTALWGSSSVPLRRYSSR